MLFFSISFLNIFFEKQTTYSNMKHVLILILLLPFTLFSQKPTNSLLWKITSPETQKTSYLYGTMHISGRLAFHLGEEFFDAITEVDAVALESNPIIWLDEIFNSPYASDYLGKYGFQKQTYKGFYQNAFKLSTPDNESLGEDLAEDHYLSNWMLYRENKSQLDFEEETFLDLFIYQTGRKNSKQVYSLENFSQTTHLSKLGGLPDPEKKEESAWFEELTEEKSTRILIQDAYRNKDVMLLDSIHSQINSDNFIKYMLDVRNDIMAVKIDSFIKKEDISLFIGIGAAHLGGNYGVIQYLKDKGYSVTPMNTTITDKAKQRKETFDKKTTSISYGQLFESEMFSVKVPGDMFETPSNSSNQRQFFSPELTNGSYFSIKQISTYSYFSKLDQTNYISKIDSLLFESIPGNIISKDKIQKNGFEAIDILNQTANGNFQRYQIVITPLNIIIFKMGGKGELVKHQGNGFFESIQLKKIDSKQWVDVQSSKYDFKIKVPSYYHIKSNDKVTSLYGHTELEAYDSNTKSYYFLKRASIHDFGFIEQDSYELDRLADKFFEDLDIDSFDVEILKDTKYPSVAAHALNQKNEHINIKIIIKGPYYYLMASISKENNDQNQFFSSFEFGDFKYNFPFETKSDSTLLFTVKSNYLYPTIYADLYTKAYNVKRENEKKIIEDLSFKSNSESRMYYSENFERIYVETYKFHSYSEYDNIDSLWAEEIRYMKRKNGLILKSKTQKYDNDLHTLELEFTDTSSSRMIKVKEILSHGLLYTLKANIDTISQPSDYISNFFDTFTPLDTLVGESIFEDKSKKFVRNIYSQDSLKKDHALQSVKTHIRFSDGDFEDMKKIITSYPFSGKQISIKRQMITDLGKIKHKEISPFLVELYNEVEDTAMYQLAILEALSRQKTKKSHRLFLDLLEKDIPISGESWGTYNIYAPFFDSLELVTEVYPDLLNYTFVTQHKTPIYKLLSTTISEGKIKGKTYKKNYKQLLREAKIEVKSQISYEQNEQGKKTNQYSYKSYKYEGNTLLVDYGKLLLPFYKKSSAKAYFEKLDKVKDFKVQTEINIEKIKYNIPVNDTVWNFLAKDLINRNFLFAELEDIKRLDLFPKAYKTQQKIAESLLYERNFNPEKDSMQFIEVKEVVVLNDTGYVYFFKSKGENDDDWELDYVGLQPKSEKDINIDPQFVETDIKIEKYKKIDEIIDEEIETIKLDGHRRAKKTSKSLDYSWLY